MKHQSRNPVENSSSRCSHVFPSGRRCRLPVNGTDSPFCHRHRPKIDPAAELARDLSEAAGTLSTPEEIHRFLTRVTLLRIQGRLTPKEACGYAYLCQILQRGQREIAFHQKLRDERAQRAAEQAEEDEVMSWSIPRPKYDDEENPGESSTSESDTTNSIVEVSPPAQPSSAQTPAQLAPLAAKSSESFTSSTSSPSRDFYNHFFPIDPNLPPGLQDPRKNIPPPDEDECRRLAARRGLNCTRRRPNSSGVLR